MAPIASELGVQLRPTCVLIIGTSDTFGADKAARCQLIRCLINGETQHAALPSSTAEQTQIGGSHRTSELLASAASNRTTTSANLAQAGLKRKTPPAATLPLVEAAAQGNKRAAVVASEPMTTDSAVRDKNLMLDLQMHERLRMAEINARKDVEMRRLDLEEEKNLRDHEIRTRELELQEEKNEDAREIAMIRAISAPYSRTSASER